MIYHDISWWFKVLLVNAIVQTLFWSELPVLQIQALIRNCTKEKPCPVPSVSCNFWGTLAQKWHVVNVYQCSLISQHRAKHLIRMATDARSESWEAIYSLQKIVKTQAEQSRVCLTRENCCLVSFLAIATSSSFFWAFFVPSSSLARATHLASLSSYPQTLEEQLEL